MGKDPVRLDSFVFSGGQLCKIICAVSAFTYGFRFLPPKNIRRLFVIKASKFIKYYCFYLRNEVKYN